MQITILWLLKPQITVYFWLFSLTDIYIFTQIDHFNIEGRLFFCCHIMRCSFYKLNLINLFHVLSLIAWYSILLIHFIIMMISNSLECYFFFISILVKLVQIFLRVITSSKQACQKVKNIQNIHHIKSKFSTLYEHFNSNFVMKKSKNYINI